MKKESRDSFFKHYVNSTKYSVQGLIDTFKNERSFHLWLGCFLLFLVVGFLFSFSLKDFGIILVLFFFILIVELLNTAIEHTVDLVTKEIHPLAKRAKDCGSAASLIITLITILVGIVILIPYL